MFSFVEARSFTRLARQYLSDDEHRALQLALIENPEVGLVIPGTGGVRKLRWAAPGRGKRGGYRIAYCLRRNSGIIWLLTIYPKNVADAISADLLKKIREEIEDGER